MNDFTLANVNEMYIDVLREIGNIGAGNATTSLASMINEQIDMNVPKVELMEASKLSSAICPEDEIIVGIFLEVTHDITGSMMFLMRMDSAHYLVNKLMGRDPENDAPFDEMDLSFFYPSVLSEFLFSVFSKGKEQEKPIAALLLTG